MEECPILPALVGLTALQSVRTAATARLLQFLLTSSTGMDTGSEFMLFESGRREGVSERVSEGRRE